MNVDVKFKEFVYQVLVDGQLVFVVDDNKTMAEKLVKKNFKGAHVVILPVPVFTCL